MILHKENTLRAESFINSISNITSDNEELKSSLYGSSELKMLEKYSYFIQNLMAFEQEIKNDSHIQVLSARFLKYLKGIIPIKSLSLMLFDDLKRELLPVNKTDDLKLVNSMNHFNREGIFSVMFQDKKSIVIPELDSYNASGSRLYYLVFPIHSNEKDKGILSILTSLDQNNITELEKKNIQMFLNILLGKLEKIKLTEKLNDTYEELQTYQAKLSNDFRLSAIGELTEGITEDIVTPLQVIMSNVDLLSNDETSNSELTQIKSQIKKINDVVGRLVKFADVNHDEIKIQPCNLNNIIEDYFKLVKSTLENANLEYILDFDKGLPPILSHPNYVYQLLTNLFSLIKSYKKEKGGIIIQTRYREDNIYLRMISTSAISGKTLSENDSTQQKLSVSIIKNIMKKHEGKLEFDSFENSGAALVLLFPLKRKIRR